jgi:hypothetical protein
MRSGVAQAAWAPRPGAGSDRKRLSLKRFDLVELDRLAIERSAIAAARDPGAGSWP